MADLAAEQWLEANCPDALADFPPDPDSERERNRRQRQETELTELAGYWEGGSPTRPGARRSAGYRRAEALEPQTAELAEAEHARTERIEAAPCGHCGAGVAKYGATLCHPCYMYRTRAGRLPPAAVVARRRGRMVP